METMQIEFQPNLKSKILDLLGTFPQDQVKIVENNSSFLLQRQKFKLVSDKIKEGTINYVDIDKLDDSLEKTIFEYEN